MPLHEGENVGPYRVIGQLGQGGMATVYKAFHAQLNRYVAIKMMHTAFQENESFHARFRREAQIVALLEHPHIVPVYDFNDYQNQPYLVMKFIEGKTLKGTLVDGALTLQQVLHVMTAVASALTYAHSKGVLHRDIKPSNVVIDGDNVPYLTDFGLARIAEAGESTLSADMILGTPHYISPEQALGVKTLSAGTDIYSLGVVLYELVVGRVPFSADTPYAIIHDHIYTPLPMPSKVNPDIPPGVEMVLLKALAKDPLDRYESAVEMVEAFKQAVSDSGLSELKSDRVSNAAVSLARLRHAMNSQLIAGSTLNVPGISSPMLQQISASQLLQQKKREKRWLWGGVASFLVICALSGFITLNAVNTLRNLDERLEVNFTEDITTDGDVPPPAVTPEVSSANNSPLDNERLVPRLEVAELSLEEAQEAIDADESDAAAHLALAAIYGEENRREDARTALVDGFMNAENQVSYLMTAGDIVIQSGDLEIAAVLYLAALHLSEGTEVYPAARAEVGHFLYDVTAEPPSIDFPLFMNMSERQPNLPQINREFINPFGTRNMFNHGERDIALPRMASSANRPNALAEAHLVYGEALLVHGDNAEALEQLNLAFNADDAPQWVRDRAEELIATIEE